MIVRLQTARLILRPFTFDDLDALHAMWIDPAVRRYLFDNVAISRERAEEIVAAAIAAGARNGRGMWLVHDAPAGEPCGFCGFLPREDEAELIYGLLPRVWGRGYAIEAARTVIAHAFDVLGVERIVASTDAPNEASARVMDRLGMRFVRREVVNGLDLVFYELARDAFATGPDTVRR